MFGNKNSDPQTSIRFTSSGSSFNYKIKGTRKEVMNLVKNVEEKGGLWIELEVWSRDNKCYYPEFLRVKEILSIG